MKRELFLAMFPLSHSNNLMKSPIFFKLKFLSLCSCLRFLRAFIGMKQSASGCPLVLSKAFNGPGRIF